MFLLSGTLVGCAGSEVVSVKANDIRLILSFGELIFVGAGSYTLIYPGVDVAWRNGYPSSTPYLSGAAAKPVPTDDWWSNFIKEVMVVRPSLFIILQILFQRDCH